MITPFAYIGMAVFLLFGLGWPIVAYRQYLHSSYHKKAALVRTILLALCAIAALLLFILIVTNNLHTNNPEILIVIFLDAQVLINWWIVPAEKWAERRERRGRFIALLVFSVILAIALVGILFTNL